MGSADVDQLERSARSARPGRRPSSRARPLGIGPIDPEGAAERAEEDDGVTMAGAVEALRGMSFVDRTPAGLGTPARMMLRLSLRSPARRWPSVGAGGAAQPAGCEAFAFGARPTRMTHALAPGDRPGDGGPPASSRA